MIWCRSRGFSGVTFALSWTLTSEGGAAESDFTLQLAVEGVGALHCLRALKHVAVGVSAPRSDLLSLAAKSLWLMGSQFHMSGSWHTVSDYVLACNVIRVGIIEPCVCSFCKAKKLLAKPRGPSHLFT